MTTYPVIREPESIEPWTYQELELNGIGMFKVQVDRSKSVEMHFLDLRRFNESVENAKKMGLGCFYKENLVVLTKLNKEDIERAIDHLFASGYFERR
jgi:hypothetical protein